MKILIDKDDTIYNFTELWYSRHNADYGDIHQLIAENGQSYETGDRCRLHNCPADLLSYFKEPLIWIEGEPLSDSIDVTKRWIMNGHELVVLTKIAGPIAAKPSMDWLNIFYPHIPDIMMVTGHIKHWAIADILIDDAIYNHSDFKGISVLYNQPWNINDTELPRANDWNQLDRIITRAEIYINDYYKYDGPEYEHHKRIQHYLRLDIEEGLI